MLSEATTSSARPSLAPQWFRVEYATQELPQVTTLGISPARGSRTPPFMPGQFNMLYAFGLGEVPISISSDPRQPGPVLHTIADVGGVTHALAKLRPGDCLGVRGPFGTHWPVERAEGDDILLVAGGIGLAPLRPALYHLLAHRERYGRIFILYGARSPDSILYAPELRHWRGRFDLEVEVTVDHARAGWRGHVGVVTGLFRRVNFDQWNTTAFICGPEVMMRAAVWELLGHGLEADTIYVSLERNMKCGVGLCGRCQLGRHFVCRDGPVFAYPEVADVLQAR